MTERAPNVERKFKEADEESWWHCLSPDCNRAYQKKECQEACVCPYCGASEYKSKPWESAMLDNPDFPRTPESGHIYTPHSANM